MTQPKAYPKGGRCAACQHRDADCSWRDFENMPPMQKDGDEVIVKCTGFERGEYSED